MYILIVCIILLPILIIISLSEWACDRDIEFPFGLAALFNGIIIFMLLATLIFSSIGVDYRIQQLNIKREIYEEYLKDPNKEAERVAFLSEIIKFNQGIASDIYWNNTQWDWWINDKYTKLKPIK